MIARKNKQSKISSWVKVDQVEVRQSRRGDKKEVKKESKLKQPTVLDWRIQPGLVIRENDPYMIVGSTSPAAEGAEQENGTGVSEVGVGIRESCQLFVNY